MNEYQSVVRKSNLSDGGYDQQAWSADTQVMLCGLPENAAIEKGRPPALSVGHTSSSDSFSKLVHNGMVGTVMPRGSADADHVLVKFSNLVSPVPVEPRFLRAAGLEEHVSSQ
eukprot:4932230-Pyramimonas_sp.AAC.1